MRFVRTSTSWPGESTSPTSSAHSWPALLAVLLRQTSSPRSLPPLAAEYDLVLIDTSPVDVTLQNLALGAARWLVIPTKADASSIRGIRRIAERVVDVRTPEHRLDILGVVLTGIGMSATRVRADATQDIHALAGESAPLFDATIRGSDAVARETRAKGLLVHELPEQVEGAEPFWKALRDGHSQQRLPGSAPALGPTTTSASASPRSSSGASPISKKPPRESHDRRTLRHHQRTPQIPTPNPPLRVADEPDGDTASESPAQPDPTRHPPPAANAKSRGRSRR